MRSTPKNESRMSDMEALVIPAQRLVNANIWTVNTPCLFSIEKMYRGTVSVIRGMERMRYRPR